jgi:histidine triad (HIT) family protein
MPSLFTKIINGEIPTEKLYEDKVCLVIKDINPQKKTHLLVIPKKEISSISELKKEDLDIVSHLIWIAKNLMQKARIPGYQLHWNVNKEGGQEIMHLHLHILADYPLKI